MKDTVSGLTTHALTLDGCGEFLLSRNWAETVKYKTINMLSALPMSVYHLCPGLILAKFTIFSDSRNFRNFHGLRHPRDHLH